MSSSRKDSLIPPDDVRCIWMRAGILSYRLCDRMCDCDNCPLDAAMRKHFSGRTEARPPQSESRVAPGTSPEPLRDGVQYSRNHCWTRPLDSRALCVGVEPGLATALLDPKTVVFPSVGQHLQKGQTCLWIVMEGGTLPLDSPCSGTVRATNRRLGDQPHLLHLSPHDEGWLFELELEGESLLEANLMSAGQAGTAYGEDEARFMKFLGNAFQGNHPQVGPTLADGGQRLQNLAELLGPARYFSILRKVYGA